MSIQPTQPRAHYQGRHRGHVHLVQPVEPDTIGRHRGTQACDTVDCTRPGWVIAECTYLVEGEPRALGAFAICPAHLRIEQDQATRDGVRQPWIVEIITVHPEGLAS